MIAMLMLVGLTISRPPPHPSLPGFGIEGGISCNHAWAPEHRVASESFVAGFWEGADLSSLTPVGRTLGREGIVAAVRERCRRTPTALLADAVSRSYTVARAQGR